MWIIIVCWRGNVLTCQLFRLLTCPQFWLKVFSLPISVINMQVFNWTNSIRAVLTNDRYTIVNISYPLGPLWDVTALWQVFLHVHVYYTVILTEGTELTEYSTIARPKPWSIWLAYWSRINTHIWNAFITLCSWKYLDCGEEDRKKVCEM